MIFAVIAAGGIGSRMGNAEMPKQFIKIGGKPILIHTVLKFVNISRIDKVIVLCPESWVSYTRDLMDEYLPGNDVIVISGGADRNGTIMNAAAYAEENFGLDDETIFVTHDAVRPFVTERIIDENIDLALEGANCSTVIPATDTITVSEDGQIVSSVPDRSHYYMTQTPQTFRAKRFRELYQSLSDEEKAVLTDAAKVFVVKGDKVTLVRGETFNIKLTYPYDLRLAESILSE